MKSDCRYWAEIVDNNFPWPDGKFRNASQPLTCVAEIENAALGILDARTKYHDSSLADLYDSLTMLPELRKAHQANDAAVMRAYGFPRGPRQKRNRRQAVQALRQVK